MYASVLHACPASVFCFDRQMGKGEAVIGKLKLKRLKLWKVQVPLHAARSKFRELPGPNPSVRKLLDPQARKG